MPVGRCVYCGTIEPPLGREHILAYALGGDAVLPNASCTTCADVTKKFENYCADTIFLSLRVHRGLHSRRPRKTMLPVYESFDDSSPALVSVDDHPGTLMLPSFDPPGIVMGRPPSQGTGLRLHVWGFTNDHDERVGRLRQSGMRIIDFKQEIDLQMFFRLLAKTAHCAFIAKHGPESFRPLLTKLILEGDEDAPYYIGCTSERRAGPSPHLNLISTEIRDIGGKMYGVVFLTLFPYLETPHYSIVVGEFIEPKDR